MSRIKTLKLQTRSPQEMVDITHHIRVAIQESNVINGVCYIYCPHTTGAITINENTDPEVKIDVIEGLERIIPVDAKYRHREGNSAAHIKSSLVGPSEFILVAQGKPVLGTWQGIFFCEFDGPRNRKVLIKIISRTLTEL